MTSKVSMSYTEQEEQRDHNIQLVRENKGKKPELYRCEYPEKDNSICSFVGVHAAINEHFFQHTGAYSIQCMICNRYFGGKLEFHHHRKVCCAKTSQSRPIHKPFFQVENDAELRSIFIRPATTEEKKEAKGTDGFFNWSSRVERPNFNNIAWDGYHHLNESEEKKRERMAANHSENIRKRHGREPSPVRESGSSSSKRHRYNTDDYRKRRRSRSSSGSPENRHRSSRGSRKEEGSRRSGKVPEATTNDHHASESTSDVPMLPPKKKKIEMSIPLVLATEVPQQTLEGAIPSQAESENPVFHGPPKRSLAPGASPTSSSISQGEISVSATQPGSTSAPNGTGSCSPYVRTPTSHSEVSSAMAHPDEDSGLDTVTKEPASTVAKDPAATVSEDSAATVTRDPAATVTNAPAVTVTKDSETVEESSVEVITLDDSESDSDDDIICLGNFRSESAKASSSTQTDSLEMMAPEEPVLRIPAKDDKSSKKTVESNKPVIQMPVKTNTVENGPNDAAPSEPSTPRENLLAKNSVAPMIRFLNTSGREIGSMMLNGHQGSSGSSRNFSNLPRSCSPMSDDGPDDQRQKQASSASPSKNRYSPSMPYKQRMPGSSSGSIEANGTTRESPLTTASQDPAVKSSESSAPHGSSAPQQRRLDSNSLIHLQGVLFQQSTTTVPPNPPGATSSMTSKDHRGNSYKRTAGTIAKEVPTSRIAQPTILVNTPEEASRGNSSSSTRQLQRPTSFPVNLKPPEEFINNDSRNYLIPASLEPRKKSELSNVYDANSPSNCVARLRAEGDTSVYIPPPMGYEPQPVDLETPEAVSSGSSVMEEETSDQEVRSRWNEMIRNREPTNMNENEAEASDANLTSSDTNDSEEASEGSPAPETSRHMSRESPSPEPRRRRSVTQKYPMSGGRHRSAGIRDTTTTGPLLSPGAVQASRIPLVIPLVHQSRQESSSQQLLSPRNLVPRTYPSGGFLLQKPPLPRTVSQQIPTAHQQSTLQRTLSSGTPRVPESVRPSPGNINLPIQKPPGAKDIGTSSQRSIPMYGDHGRAGGVTHRVSRDFPPVQTVLHLQKVARKRRADQEAANIKNGRHG